MENRSIFYTFSLCFVFSQYHIDNFIVSLSKNLRHSFNVPELFWCQQYLLKLNKFWIFFFCKNRYHDEIRLSESAIRAFNIWISQDRFILSLNASIINWIKLTLYPLCIRRSSYLTNKKVAKDIKKTIALTNRHNLHGNEPKTLNDIANCWPFQQSQRNLVDLFSLVHLNCVYRKQLLFAIIATKYLQRIIFKRSHGYNPSIQWYKYGLKKEMFTSCWRRVIVRIKSVFESRK